MHSTWPNTVVGYYSDRLATLIVSCDRCNRCDNRATAEQAIGTSDLVEKLPKLLAYVLPVFSRRHSMRFVAGHVLRSQDVRLVRGVALAQTEILTRLSHVLPLCVCVCMCARALACVSRIG